MGSLLFSKLSLVPLTAQFIRVRALTACGLGRDATVVTLLQPLQQPA